MAGSSAQITFAFLAKDAASKSINAIGRNLKGLGGVAKTIGKGIAIGIAGIGAAFAGAAIAAKNFAVAAAGDRAEQAKLISILEARGLATEANIKATESLIAAGQNLAFTDSEVRAGITTATQFTNDFAVAQKILTVAQDVARAKNISLEEATTIVGKAYQGNTKALKGYGIETKKGAKGLTVLTALTAKFGGVAEKNADTAAAQFEILRIKMDEAKETIGGPFLDAAAKVFKALQPFVDEFLAGLDKKLPDLEKFTDNIANELIKKIPGWVRTAKRELPPLIDKVKEFFLEATKFSDSAVKALGPDGLITTGIAAIGFKIGGLKGALAGALTKGFSDVGLGPFESLLAGAVGSAILAGLAEGLASQAALALIAAFKARMVVASTIPTPIPTTVPIPPAAGGTGIMATLTAAATSVGGAIASIGASGAAALAAAGVVLAGIGTANANMRQARVDRGDITSEQATMEASQQGGQPMFTPAPGSSTAKTMIADWNNFMALLNPFDGGKTRADQPTYVDPMSQKYGSPEFNVYVGGSAVAGAVVPILAREYSVNPKGGR
jgi:hypothetical protein